MAISTDSAISLSGVYPKEITRRKKEGGLQNIWSMKKYLHMKFRRQRIIE